MHVAGTGLSLRLLPAAALGGSLSLLRRICCSALQAPCRVLEQECGRVA